jgi:hypothetical protein
MKFARLEDANAALADFARSHSPCEVVSSLGGRSSRTGSEARPSIRPRLVAEPDIPAAPRR